jgi:hypothetical protein
MTAPRTLPRIAGAVIEHLDDLAERATAETMRQEQAYRELVPPDDLRQAARDTMELTLWRLTRRAPPPRLARVEEILGERRAEQGVPLEDLMRTFHRDFQVLWEALLTEAKTGDERESGALLGGARRLWEAVELSASRSVQAYRDAESRMARRDWRRRQMLLEGLFEGRHFSASAAREAAQTLRIPEFGRFVVSAVDDRGHQVSGAAQGEAALTSIGRRSVWRSRPDCSVGLILCGDTPVGELAAVLSQVPVRGALSHPFESIRETPLATTLAILGLQSVATHANDVVLLDDRLPEALVCTHYELADRLVHTTLGAVLGLGDAERERLIGTMRTFLDCDSVEEAATRLYCHRNTVLQRLRRWEELTGRSPRALRYAAELRLALHAHAHWPH